VNWFRAHHGISTNAKLAMIAMRTGCRKCEVGWVWMALLDYASQNEACRGNVAAFQPEEISLLTDVPVESVIAILETLQQRRTIGSDGTIMSWDERQPESDCDRSTPRVQKYRAKQRELVQNNTKPVTETHETFRETHETQIDRTDRTEQREQNKKKSGVSASGRFREFWERYPLKNGENLCAGVWTGIVTVEMEEPLFACLGRYLDSEQVHRGVVMKPNNWLHDCSRDGWRSDWPKAHANGSGKQTQSQILKELYGDLND
jgi:hypothetical protein